MTWRIIVWIALAASVATFAIAQEVAYTHYDGILRRIDLSDGSVEPVGDVSWIYITSLAFSQGGELYGLSYDGDLFLFDTTSGEASNLGTITVAPGHYPTGLTFDREGRLILLANGHPQSALYEIDPATVTASLILSVDSDTVTSIAISGTAAFASSQGRLSRVDLSTGAVLELPGYSGWFYSNVVDLSFDGGGHLLAIELTLSPISGCYANSLVRFDLDSGEYVPIVQLAVPLYECAEALAILPSSAAHGAAVPTQSPLGCMLLIVLIAGFGLGLLARR